MSLLQDLRASGFGLVLFSFALSIVFSATATAGAEPGEANEEDNAIVQLRRVIEAAKDRVYPALVFVKPIQEDIESGEARKREVLGSGVIISPDGLVVTNFHVVEHALVIRCVLSDKRQVEAKLLGKDPETDLALLKLTGLDPTESLPYAEFANSDLVEAGDFVMAMGSPFGFERSVSLGIISNTRRYMGFESQYIYNTFIQTDAAINPGNSGGPLVDVWGRVVGINTLAIRGGDGIGFAIPSNIVQDIVARLRKHGRVIRAYTGLQLQPLKDFNTNTFIDSDRGVLIRDIRPMSPAAAAGVKPGDLLVAVNNEPVTAMYIEDLPHVERLLADLPIGEPATLHLLRGDNELTVEIVPEERGSLDLAYFNCEMWGFTAKEYNEFSEPTLAFYKKQGVCVSGVKYPSAAQRAGLRERDIILSIDGKAIESIEDLKRVYEEAIQKMGRQRRVLIRVQRAQLSVPMVLDYSRAEAD